MQTQGIEQCVPVVVFIMLHKVLLASNVFESVDEILKCADHSNESY